MERTGASRLAALVIGVCVVVALAACDALSPTAAPGSTAGSSSSEGPGAVATEPAILIDATWTTENGQWTFTGTVDPQGDSTDVILEVGPGPSNARVFDHHVPVAQGLTVPTPLTVTTNAIPDIPLICVRFSATNSSGTSVTSPLCFPHDVPSLAPVTGPPVTAFSAPVIGSTSTIKVATFTVTWTESGGGGGIAFRSLQRQVATDAGGVCGSFADDGAASTAPSPVAVSGLLGGHCYQWIETLRDHGGVTTQTTSGIVHVDLPA